MLQLLWCPHTQLSGDGPAATWGCGGPGDEGQPGTADTLEKAGTYLRAGGGPCPGLLSLITTPPSTAWGQEGNRQSATAGAAVDGMEGAVCSIAAAEQVLGQLAEPGCLSSLSSRTRGAPSVVPGCPGGELGAGEAPCGAGAVERVPGTCHPPCCLATLHPRAGRRLDSFLLPDPGECRAPLLPAPRPGEGEQGGVRVAEPLQEPPCPHSGIPARAPLTVPQSPAAPACPPLARSPPEHPANPWMGPAGSYKQQQQQLNTKAEPAAGKHPRGCSQRAQPGSRRPSPALLLRHVPRGFWWHAALCTSHPATSTRPHTCPAGTLCTGIAHVRWPQQRVQGLPLPGRSPGLLCSEQRLQRSPRSSNCSRFDVGEEEVMLGQPGTWWHCHCSTAPGFQASSPFQKEKGSKWPPAETSCFLITSPGGRAAVGPGLSLHFILQGQEQRTDWDRYLLMTMENYPHANARGMPCRAAPGTAPAPAHPFAAGLALAVTRQQRFLLPTRVFWMRDRTGLLWPERIPRDLALGAVADSSPTTGRRIRGWGDPRSALAPAARGCSPPVPQTRSRGSPE